MINPTNLPVRYDLITQPERRLVRLEYIERQNNLCHHCHCPLDEDPCEEVMTARITESRFPAGFFHHPIHLHHNKKTGYTIGAVHARCNAYLFQYHDE